MSLKVEEVLYEGRSDFQDVLVFRSATYGTVLVLDGVIQVTERDEHAYQEMITHIPMHCHPDPQSVLIVGGGDGGVLREVCRHPGVQRITMCEIDPLVCKVAQQYLGGSTAVAFDDPRVTLVHADAAEYVKDQMGQYDVVIVDSSDPVGPAETLFTAGFYTSLRHAMRPGYVASLAWRSRTSQCEHRCMRARARASHVQIDTLGVSIGSAIMCNQGECMWLHLDLIGEVLSHCKEVFPSVDYAFTTIPTYPSGQIGFLVCSTSPNHVLRQPVRAPEPSVAASLRYYSPAVHAASFVLVRRIPISCVRRKNP